MEATDAYIGAPVGGDVAGMNRHNLTTAKETRKRAELDAQLLANRIALLKQEEEKAWKKINETQTRAREIKTLRQQNQKVCEAKCEFYKKKWESIRAAQAQNAYQRDKARATRFATSNALREAKSTGAKGMRIQSQNHIREKKQREGLELLTNRRRTEYIKRCKHEGRMRCEQNKNARSEQTRQDYEARVAQEELLRSRTESLVAKMEKEEMELITKLQNTQMIQRQALDELEVALSAASDSVSAPMMDKMKPKRKERPAPKAEPAA